MKNNQKPIIIVAAALILVGIILSFFLIRTKKSDSGVPSPTPAPKLVEIEVKDRPNISLTPRKDGHELTLKIDNISPIFSKIEYEITYIAVDNTLEIEKGASGIIDSEELSITKVERKILLGTESCTNGCKYKYDAGVTGGNLSLIFTLKNGQFSIFDTPFILKSTADIIKSGQLQWPEEDFTYTFKSKPTGSHFYIAHKNFIDGSYLVTSSGSL